MHRITLKDYRCFGNEQSARLAPLTLLVGENSTGKTSFLAMTRMIWDIAAGNRPLNFNETPFSLGSFNDIAHYRGSDSGQSPTFEIALKTNILSSGDQSSASIENNQLRLSVVFGKSGTSPIIVRRRRSVAGAWIEERYYNKDLYCFHFGTERGVWRAPDHSTVNINRNQMSHVLNLFTHNHILNTKLRRTALTPVSGSADISPDDLSQLESIIYPPTWLADHRAFASAPVRSRPYRTYDPYDSEPDPEGTHVPMYLASAFFQDKTKWSYLKTQLEVFGEISGLFDEIHVRQLGELESDPFQLQIGKFGHRLRGPMRNLIDVGYGVSQALPVITDILRLDTPALFLLQQPEVHLHPSAQAALGSVLCRVASKDRQFLIETHSDHLMDRVRMDVRDGLSDLKPQDVSILFFERNELDVRIHSLRIDEEGNIRDAPEGYRQFFMEETRRSLGL